MKTALSNVKVLVTGISGFIGSHLARRLVKEGAEVSGLIRKNSDLLMLMILLCTVAMLYYLVGCVEVRR